MCIKEWCNIFVVSEGNKNTQHIYSVQCPVTGKAGVMDCLSTGSRLLTPFLFNDVCAAEVR